VASRVTRLEPPVRCAFILLSIMLINLGDVMPLYCASLLVPVLGTLSGVFGDAMSIKDTSTLLVEKLFNSTSSMVLGALVINGVFTKCGLETRFMAWLLENFLLEGPVFLLILMVGGALFCAVLYSGSMVMLLALAPVLETGAKRRIIAPAVAKRILLAVAISANAGSALLPISSPVNLITVASLEDFDYAISVHTWAAIAAPVILLTLLFAWLMLLLLFRPDGPEKSKERAWEEQRQMVPATHVELTYYHILFLGVGFVAVLCITIYATKLEPIIGHSASISLCVVVVVFGSGFMTRDEFCQLDWDILFLVGGSNIMVYMVHKTGLGNELSTRLVSSHLMDSLPYQGMVLLLVCAATLCSTFLSHNITGVLLMPIVIAVGVKVRAAETTAILIAVAVHCGMGLASSSFDNILAQATSETLGRRGARLKKWDWCAIGGVTSLVAALLLVALGYNVAAHFYDLPPPSRMGGAHREASVEAALAQRSASFLAVSTEPPEFFGGGGSSGSWAPHLAAAPRRRVLKGRAAKRQQVSLTAAAAPSLELPVPPEPLAEG